MQSERQSSSVGTSKAQRRVEPPKTWKDPAVHWVSVLNHPWYQHLARIQHRLYSAIHDFFTSRGFMILLMPVTTSSISSPMGLGSDSLPVEVDLFGVRTYLADSMQFMLEFGCRLHNSGAYYIMPCFRGERTDAYHLPQFYHAEAELRGDLDDALQLASSMIHHISSDLVQHCRESIEEMAGGVDHILNLIALDGHYPSCRLHDAIAELESIPNSEPFIERNQHQGAVLLTRSGEAELARTRGDAGAIWVSHFDQTSVPFYQAVETGTGCALNADLILGTCETIGCGQRHTTSEDVRLSLERHQIQDSPYTWYMSMRDIKPTVTSGFGMGIERYLLWLLQHDDIRDLTMLYRENGVATVP